MKIAWRRWTWAEVRKRRDFGAVVEAMAEETVCRGRILELGIWWCGITA